MTVSAAQREAIAEAVARAMQPALNEWSETGGNPWFARVSGAQKEGDQARILGRYVADAVLVLVEAWLDGAVQAERERADGLRDTLLYLADLHHRTLTNSRLHEPQHQEWDDCPCLSCKRVLAAVSLDSEAS